MPNTVGVHFVGSTIVTNACRVFRNQRCAARSRLTASGASRPAPSAAGNDVITKVDGFGELRENQHTTRERPTEIVKLIEKYRGKDLAGTARIKQLLTDAIELCDDRNHLAHGNWWRFIAEPRPLELAGSVR